MFDGPLTVRRVNDDTGSLLLLGLGTTAGVAAMALALVPALRGAHIRLRFLLSLKHAAVRTMLRLSGWTVGYVVANQIALWVVLVLANGVDGGAFAYLSAYAFFQLPHGLFSVSIMTAVGPDLAQAGARGDLAALRHRFAAALRLVLTVVIPAAAVYVALARPFVVALLQRGAFSPSDAALVADTLVGFAVGLPFFSTYLFALRAFYALEDTRTPFLLNCLENAANIVLALWLFDELGIDGLAYAFSGAYALAAVVTPRCALAAHRWAPGPRHRQHGRARRRGCRRRGRGGLAGRRRDRLVDLGRRNRELDRRPRRRRADHGRGPVAGPSRRVPGGPGPARRAAAAAGRGVGRRTP